MLSLKHVPSAPSSAFSHTNHVPNPAPPAPPTPSCNTHDMSYLPSFAFLYSMTHGLVGVDEAHAEHRHAAPAKYSYAASDQSHVVVVVPDAFNPGGGGGDTSLVLMRNCIPGTAAHSTKPPRKILIGIHAFLLNHLKHG